jgi:hypothetical protein
MVAPNKQLERTVIRRRERAACASFHYAHAARWTGGHAAAQLRRYASMLTLAAMAWVSTLRSAGSVRSSRFS